MRTRTIRQRDEAGVAAPSPVVMLSVIAVAMAGIAFIVTHDDDGDRALQNVSQAEPTPTPTETATQEPRPLPPPRKKKPAVKRSAVIVEVYNNSGVRGLAGRTAEKASVLGWQVVGSDNWVGAIPAPTVYYGPRLEAAARLLGKDLGITRFRPAVAPMRPDRLTVILTADYS
jgi:hypothetical protein